MKKTRMAWIFLLAVILLVPTKAFAADQIRLFIKGSYIEGDVSPMIVNNRTLVPLRLVSENLGCDVNWRPEDQSIRIIQGARALDLKLGSKTAYILENGGKKAISMDVSPLVVKNRTLVPIRFISENFGEKVTWDPDNKTVAIGQGYSPKKTLGEMTLRFRDRSFNIKTKAFKGQTMVPARDFAKGMGWSYVNKPNEYEEKVPVLWDTMKGIEIWNYDDYFQCDGISFTFMDGGNKGLASKQFQGQDYLSLRHLADVLHADLTISQDQIVMQEKKQPASYKLYYKPLLGNGESYGYEAAKVNSIQFKNHHYFIMPMNKTPEEYVRLGIYDKEMTPKGMCNFYMNPDKKIVEVASQG